MSYIRALRWAQEARGVAPSTVSHNIQDILDLIAPGAEVPATCERTNQIMCGEVTLAGEAMAAWKFAACKRVMTVGWDESTKFGDAVLSCNFQIMHQDETVEDICLRGLSIMPNGGTSKAVLEHIEKRILALYSRNLLTRWMEEFEKEYGAGSWARADGPSPENIGLHRLCEDTVLMTDTCNGAWCTKQMLAARQSWGDHQGEGWRCGVGGDECGGAEHQVPGAPRRLMAELAQHHHRRDGGEGR